MNQAATIDDMTKDDVRARLRSELAEVESRFAAELVSDLACVNSLATHVERYRGKMLRPMLVILTGMASAGDRRSVTEAHRVVATVVEMVHIATLVHDDILDDAEVRRRAVTINHLRGNEAAVMLGDFLISHAYHLCSSLDSSTPSRIIADATNVVCEGELLQLANRENWALDEGTYFEIIRRKTASLCGTCCRLGGSLHPAVTRHTSDTLYSYGEKLGIAFQIVDDLLDLTGDEETVGKSLGRDLQKGKLTLPLIHHLRTASADDAGEMLALLERTSPEARTNPEITGRMMRLILSTDSLAYATQSAADLIRSAKAALDTLPDSQAKIILNDLADTVLTRKF